MPHRLLRAALVCAACSMPSLLAPGLIAQGPLADGPVEIHVDERCRIYTQDRASEGGKYSRPGFHGDTDICRIESPHKSKHWEGSVEGGVVKRTQVTVIERTYLLHDPTGSPVTFFVEQSVPAGWHVDSTPQPVSIENSVAVFQVIAKPGETIHLHVGIRH